MKLYPFSALLARMKYITRWSLMHSTRPESLSEHTCDTALLAHTLCLIARRYTGTPCRPKTVAVAALYHDAPEIITGDMPTPVKYSSPGLRDAYKALETESVDSMTRLLPPELAEEVSPFITGSLLTAEEKRLLKAADRLSAPRQVHGGAAQRKPRVRRRASSAAGGTGRDALPRGRLVHGALPPLLHSEPRRADPQRMITGRGLPARRPGPARPCAALRTPP